MLSKIVAYTPSVIKGPQSMKKTIVTIKPPRPRNPHAGAPIMRKGGAHQSARAVERQASASALRAEICAWWEDYMDEVNERYD